MTKLTRRNHSPAFKAKVAMAALKGLENADGTVSPVAKYAKPDIFNSDQGSQFTSNDFTGLLLKHGIQISMDGKGAWCDNVFVERLWRSIEYEEVYLKG